MNDTFPLTWDEYSALCAYIDRWRAATDHPTLDVDDKPADHDPSLPVVREWVARAASHLDSEAVTTFVRKRGASCDCDVWTIRSDDLPGHEEWWRAAQAEQQERQRLLAADRKRRHSRGT